MTVRLCRSYTFTRVPMANGFYYYTYYRDGAAYAAGMRKGTR